MEWIIWTEAHGSNSSRTMNEQPNARLEIRRNFFSHRVLDTWNSLPAEVKRAISTSHFKKMYDIQVVVSVQKNHRNFIMKYRGLEDYTTSTTLVSKLLLKLSKDH